jgi:Fe-S-cluster containining protein
MSALFQSDTVELPYAMRGRRQLGAGESFCFECRKDLPCFTDCCADVNIFLTPSDVLRLSRRLGLSTTEFLDRHTLLPITKDLHLPVLLLKMRDEPGKRCPFVEEHGCSVYEERPWSCRMYPLGMALTPARAGEDPKPIYFLFEESFCAGKDQSKSWTVEQWRENQGVAEREELDSGYREIVSNPWFIGGRQLDPKRIEMFHHAFHDLDLFREFVFKSSFLRRFELEEDLVENLRTSDEELLRFASRWLRFALFAEPTMKIREQAPA